MQPVIMVFDSGLGGITVYRQLREQLPEARYLYVADSAAFPYGAWEEESLTQRIIDVVEKFEQESRPDMVVVACNTASTLALDALRSRFDMPFVGTVPAIKVAAQWSKTKVFSVLATPGTVKRDYTHGLVEQFAANCEVALIGAEGLAEQAERKMSGQGVDMDAIKDMIAPCFVDLGQGRKTDYIALACTHFPLLAKELEKLSPWPVSLIDPAPAIARQAVSILEAKGFSLRQRRGGMSHDMMVFTGKEQPINQGLQDFLRQEGLGYFGFVGGLDKVTCNNS